MGFDRRSPRVLAQPPPERNLFVAGRDARSPQPPEIRSLSAGVPFPVRKLFALLLIAMAASANERSYFSLQSGAFSTPIHDRGIHGQGQVIAVLDTGLDSWSCYFAEPDGSPPPINTSFNTNNVDPSRRKVIAYDFLYSCAEFPAAPGCDDPSVPAGYDNQGHGTHAAGAAAGDRGAPIGHDFADSIAPAAKLVIQDGGFIGGDACSSRPGFGCPPRLTPILDQAYRQGARIHSNSWGDQSAPRAGYPQSARDIDAFVYAHPDMLVVFNTGNFLDPGSPPPSSLSAPGSAKNTLQVGGTRGYAGASDEFLAGYSLLGPTRDGRIKPDVVGPAYVTAGDAEEVVSSACGAADQGGTSWASPTLAGAAALVRQYYIDGFYPTGAGVAWNAMIPSAALLKATIIAAARSVPTRFFGTSQQNVPAQPVPSFEQGFGFPVLDDALYFSGDRTRLRVVEASLAEGQSTTVRLSVRSGTRFKAVLVWTDPPGHAAAAADTTPQLVNDLDLLVAGPGGAIYPNGASQPDRLNNVEAVAIDAPVGGACTISVTANHLGAGSRQNYALVITGDFDAPQPKRRAVGR